MVTSSPPSPSPRFMQKISDKNFWIGSPPPPYLETFRKFAACAPPGLPLELIYPIYLLQDDEYIFIKVILPSWISLSGDQDRTQEVDSTV